MNTTTMTKTADAAQGAQPARALVPLVDIYDGTERTLLQFDVPGARSEDIRVEVENDELRVEARPQPFLEGEPPILLARTFRLPPGIDGDAVTAECKDGVLTLTLPKPAEQKPRVIAVS